MKRLARDMHGYDRTFKTSTGWTKAAADIKYSGGLVKALGVNANLDFLPSGSGTHWHSARWSIVASAHTNAMRSMCQVHRSTLCLTVQACQRPVQSTCRGPAVVRAAATTAQSPEPESEEETVQEASARDSSIEEEDTTDDVSKAADGLSKAEARKARRIPPTIITPPTLPDTMEKLHELFSNGALLVDKPLEWTSFDVCGKLRNTLKFLNVKKVGHAGTLDPLASGLLVVATGLGTKFCDDFMAMEKEYSGVIRLGEGTATYDSEGEVIERLPWEHITNEVIQAAAASFVGDIKQVPPMYSAIKMGGQKLYDLAREGVTIDREPRPVTINSFKIWRADSASSSSASSSPLGSQDLHFHVACSKGTYIRSLAYDLGRALGTVAHLTALRRESIGAMRVTDSWQLDELLNQLYAARKQWGPPEVPRPPKQQRKPRAPRDNKGPTGKTTIAAATETETSPAVVDVHAVDAGAGFTTDTAEARTAYQ